MAANPPYEGAVFVPGTAEEIGVKLLEKADDPQDVVAYAGYGYWVPAALARKVSGAKKQDVEVGPVAPFIGDQAVGIPELDGEVADEHPQGSDEDPGDHGDPAPAPELPVATAEELENDPTANAVAAKAPSKVKAETPAENTAAADEDDPQNVAL